jgi:hypothetical protein
LDVVDGAFKKIAGRPEHNWVWSPQWAVNMHRPETWGFLEFQEKPGRVRPDPYWKERCELMDLYYRMRTYKELNGSYSPAPASWRGGFLAHEGFWMATLTAKDGAVLTVREDSRLTISR